jgi:hypothetical protein
MSLKSLWSLEGLVYIREVRVGCGCNDVCEVAQVVPWEVGVEQGGVVGRVLLVEMCTFALVASSRFCS